jgi:hypothetical protein
MCFILLCFVLLCVMLDVQLIFSFIRYVKLLIGYLLIYVLF